MLELLGGEVCAACPAAKGVKGRDQVGRGFPIAGSSFQGAQGAVDEPTQGGALRLPH